MIAGQPSSIPALSVGSLAPSLIGDHSLKIPEPQKLIMQTREGCDRIAAPRGDTSWAIGFHGISVRRQFKGRGWS